MNEIRRIEAPPTPLLLPPPDDTRGNKRDAKPDTKEDAPAKPMRRWPFLLVGVLALGALGWGGWRHWSTHREAVRAQEETRDFRPTLRVAEAKRDDAPVPLRLPGQLAPDAEARLFARATGYVAELKADIGTRVRKGDLLLRIAAPDLDAQLRQGAAQVGQMQAALVRARAEVDTAHTSVELAKVTNARTTTLAAQGWETKQNADNTRASVQSGGASLESAQAGVKVAEANLAAQLASVQRLQELVAYERVVAPFDGVVTARSVEEGDLVSADAGGATPLFTLVQDDVVRAQIRVPQSAAIGIREGLLVKVDVPELPGRSFTGHVARSTVALDRSTRTLLVEADVTNVDGLLHPGLYVNVTVAVPRQRPGVTVPAEALVYDAEGLRLFTVADNRAHMRKVEIYRDFGTSVELRDGLDGGEQVALSPPTTLQDGAEIRVAPPKQEAGKG